MNFVVVEILNEKIPIKFLTLFLQKILNIPLLCLKFQLKNFCTKKDQFQN